MSSLVTVPPRSHRAAVPGTQGIVDDHAASLALPDLTPSLAQLRRAVLAATHHSSDERGQTTWTGGASRTCGRTQVQPAGTLIPTPAAACSCSLLATSPAGSRRRCPATACRARI